MPAPEYDIAVPDLRELVEFVFTNLQSAIEGFPERLDPAEYAIRLYHELSLRSPCECWQQVLPHAAQQLLWGNPALASENPATGQPYIVAHAGNQKKNVLARIASCRQFHRYPAGPYILHTAKGPQALKMEEFHQIAVAGRKLQRDRGKWTLGLGRFGPSLLAALLAEDFGLRRRYVAALHCPVDDCQSLFPNVPVRADGLLSCEVCQAQVNPYETPVRIRSLKDHWILQQREMSWDDPDTQVYQPGLLWKCSTEDCDNHFPFPPRFGDNLPPPNPAARCHICGGTHYHTPIHLWFYVPAAVPGDAVAGLDRTVPPEVRLTFDDRLGELIPEVVGSGAPLGIVRLTAVFLLADVLELTENLRDPAGGFDWVRLHACVVAPDLHTRYRLLKHRVISAEDADRIAGADGAVETLGIAQMAAPEILRQEWEDEWKDKFERLLRNSLNPLKSERDSAPRQRRTDEPGGGQASQP